MSDHFGTLCIKGLKQILGLYSIQLFRVCLPLFQCFPELCRATRTLVSIRIYGNIGLKSNIEILFSSKSEIILNMNELHENISFIYKVLYATEYHLFNLKHHRGELIFFMGVFTFFKLYKC